MNQYFCCTEITFLCSNALILVTSPSLRTCLNLSYESLTFSHISCIENPLSTFLTLQSGASTHSKSFEASSCSENGRYQFPVTELMSPFSDLQIISPLTNVPSELSFMTQYGVNGFILDVDIIVRFLSLKCIRRSSPVRPHC